MAPPNAAPVASCSNLRRRRPTFMTTCEMRGEVELILKELKQSCRSPLFDQIEANNIYTMGRHAVRDQVYSNRSLRRGGGDDNDSAAHTGSATSVPSGDRNASKRLKREEQARGATKRRWDELLAEAAILLPFMTVEEHGILFRLVSILFLGYISPNSTGNDFFTLQDYYYRTVGLARQQQQQQRQTAGSNTFESVSTIDDMDIFLSMPLEERLEGASRYYAADEYGEIDVCYDERLEDAFQNFLWKGLAPLLEGRAAHGEETDLIHLIAMVICPHPVVWKEEEEEETDSWKKAQLLMKSRHSACFHVHYQHRLQLVQLVTEHLVLPEADSSSSLLSSSLPKSPLMTGALPHLLAALHGFSLGAMSPLDAHWAYCGCVNSVIQTGYEKIVLREWNALLKRTLQDTSLYECSSSSTAPTRSLQNGFSRSGKLMKETKSFCAHAARGELLRSFISRYNGSRHYADEVFTRKALVSLSDAIRGQLDSLMKTADDKNGKNHSIGPSRRLASLIYAATTLFFFLLPLPVEDEKETGDDSEGAEEKIKQAQERQKRDQLMACAVQCLQHPDSMVAHESASLLVTALAYGSETYTEEHALQICSSVLMAIQKCQSDSDSMIQVIKGMEPIVATSARMSKGAASSLLAYLVSEIKNAGKDAKIVDPLLRLISVVAIAQPQAASTEITKLQSLCEIQIGTTGRTHLAAAFLSCRWAHFYAKEEMVPKYLSMARGVVTGLSDSWVKYKLAKHALVTSNFSFAKDLFSDIIASSSTEESYLWFSVLSKVCEAEDTLSGSGACGIPAATPLLHSALTYLKSLSSLKRKESIDMFGFQIEFLNLRLGLLDLCSAMRALGSEMRLTGVVPKTNTRSGLHMKNMAKCFNSLASRCYKVYQHFGLVYCQPTRTSLRTFHALCRFLSRTATKVFSVKMPSKSKTEEEVVVKCPKGDFLHPMTILMQKLDEAIVAPMDESVDPVVRATALTEIIDGILMAPVPFPRGFTVVKQLPIASLRLSGDPENSKTSFTDPTVPPNTGTAYAEEDTLRKEVDVLEVLPYQAFVFCASGTIPKSYFDLADLSFSNVIASYKISYDSPLHPDEELMMEEEQSNQVGHSSETLFKRTSDDEITTVSCPLLPNGNFMIHFESRVQEEGFYKLNVQLGCRDLRCGEWKIPVAEGSQTLFVRVSRTQD